MCRLHRALLPFLVVLLAVGGPVLLRAAGQKEDPLAEARRLLAEGRISEALIRNMEVFLSDPDQQNRVLELFDKTIAKSEEAIAILNRFAAVDFSSQQGLDDGKSILGELRDLDKAPNSEMNTTLALLESRLLFQETNLQYIALMDQALPLIESGKHYEAIELYLGGFETLGRSTFDATDYKTLLAGTDLATLRENTLTDIEGVIAAAREAMGREAALTSALAAVESAVAREDAGELASGLTGLIEELDFVDARSDAMKPVAERLWSRWQTLNNEHTIWDNFLWFGYYLVTGRASTDQVQAPREGLYKSLAMKWESAARAAAELIQAKAAELLAAGKAGYESGAYEASARKLDAAYGFLTGANRLLAAWGTQFRVGEGYKLSAAGQSLVRSVVPWMLLNQEQAKETEEYRALAEPVAYLLQSRSIDASMGTAGLDAMAGARAEIDARRSRAREIREAWMPVVERYRALAESPVGSAEAASGAAAVLPVMDEAVARFDAEDTRIAEAEASIQYAELRQEFEALASRVSEGKLQIAGVEVALSALIDESGQEVPQNRVEKYPAKGRDILAAARERLSVLQGGLGAYSGRWQAEAAHVRASTLIQGYLAHDRELVATIDAMKAEIDTQVRLAGENLRLAAENKAKGDRAYAQARQEVMAERFDSSREYTQLAGEAYAKSLEYAEDAALRDLRDNELIAFMDVILDAENRIVIRDVRAYLTQGKELFSQGEYAKADELYHRAQERWLTTHPEVSKEIELALRSTRSALSFANQRVIGPENPLYDVVSQLYNTAYAAYQEAVKLMAKGQKVDAIARLADAKDTIGRIRSLVPYYQDVRVLELRIKQVEDEPAFQRDFAARLREAEGKIGSDVTEALVELQALQQISPTYRGLDDAIYRAKLAAGLVRLPPKAQDTKTSTDLYKQAYAIYVTRKPERYPEATALLDQALDLWDANQDAIVLKDTIAAQQGGMVQLVLRSDLEQKYQQALGFYRRKEYYRAKTIIDELMRDPTAKINPSVIKLQERIALEIG